MVKLIERFPRQLGRPFKDGMARSLEDINKYILKYGSTNGIHISTYAFSTIENKIIDYESAIIDKIFIDFDESNWLITLRKIFSWCENKDLINESTMSGKGFHNWIYCKEQIKNKRNTVYNFQSYLEKKLRFRMDPQMKGGLERSFRIPGTYNHRRKRYDIHLSKDMIFNWTEKEIYEAAEQFPIYKPKKFRYGTKLADLSAFDTESYIFGSRLPTSLNGEYLNEEQIKLLNIPVKKFPPCVQNWLSNKELNYKGRYNLVVYLRDQQITELPFTFSEICSIIKNTLSEKKWLHCSTDNIIYGAGLSEGLRPIRKAFSNPNYKMYSCYQLRDFYLCPKKCGRWHPIYK